MSKRQREVAPTIISLPTEIICTVYEYAGELSGLLIYVSTHKNARHEMRSVLYQILKKYEDTYAGHQFGCPLRKIIARYLDDDSLFTTSEIVWLLSVLLLLYTETTRTCINLDFRMFWKASDVQKNIDYIYYHNIEDNTICLLRDSKIWCKMRPFVGRDNCIPHTPGFLGLYKNVYLCHFDKPYRSRAIHLHRKKAEYFKRLLLFGKK